MQIRLSGLRSQMQVVILQSLAALTRVIGLAGSQGKRRPSSGMFQRIYGLLAVGKHAFCPAGRRGVWTGLAGPILRWRRVLEPPTEWMPTRRGRRVWCEQESCTARAESGLGQPADQPGPESREAASFPGRLGRLGRRLPGNAPG